MALSSELRTRLHNEATPFEKRYRLAKNMLLSQEIIFANKEDTIFAWLFQKTKTAPNKITPKDFWIDMNEIFKLFEFYTVDDDNKQRIIDVLLKDLSKNNVSKPTVNAGLILVKQAFVNWFKKNIDMYLKVFTKLLLQLNDELVETNDLFKSLNDFYRSLIDKKHFDKTFIDSFLAPIVHSCPNRTNLESFLCQTIFTTGYLETYKRDFQYFFKNVEKSENTAITLIESIFTVRETVVILDVVSTSFFRSYQKSPDLITQFCFVCLKRAGFSLKGIDFNESLKFDQANSEDKLKILHTLLTNVSKIKKDFKDLKYQLTFGEVVTRILNKSIAKKTDHVDLLRNFDILLKLDSNLFEANLGHFLMDGLVGSIESPTDVYDSFIHDVFETYEKLHREQKFTSVLLQSLDAVFGVTKVDDKIYTSLRKKIKIDSAELDRNEIVSGTFRERLSQLFGKLTSKQSIAVFRTLCFHFKSDVINALSEGFTDHLEQLIKIQTNILVIYLNAVKFADNAIPDLVLNKFLHDLHELETILQNFCQVILNNEHNPRFVASLLRLCYHLGELLIVLRLYAPYGEGLATLNVSLLDRNLEDLAYLHGYIPQGLWTSIIQRVNNFGCDRCRDYVLLLHLQKFKAISLFADEETIRDLTHGSIAFFRPHIERAIDLTLAGDVFVLDVLVSINKSDSKIMALIGKLVIKRLLTSERLDSLGVKWFENNRFLTYAVLTNCLTEIAKIINNDQLYSKFSQQINYDMLSAWNDDPPTIESNFANEIANLNTKLATESSTAQKTLLDEKDMLDCVKILVKLPLPYLPQCDLIKSCVLLLNNDLQRNFTNASVFKPGVEHLILKMVEVQNTIGVSRNFTFANFIGLIENFEEFEMILQMQITTLIKYDIGVLDDAVTFLKTYNGDRYLSVLKILLRVVFELKAVKTNKNRAEILKYRQKLAHFVVKQLKSHPDSSQNEAMLESYTYALQNYLRKDKNDYLLALSEHLKIFTEIAFKNLNNKSKEAPCINLISLVIRHNKKISDSIAEDFVQKCRACCWKLSSKVTSVLLEMSKSEQFKSFLSSHMATTRKSIASNFNVKHLNIWNAVIKSTLNAKKSQIRLDAICELFGEINLCVDKFRGEQISGVLETITNVVKNVQISLSPFLYDTILTIVTSIPNKASNQAEIFSFVHIYNLMLTILDSLLHVRSVFVLDRLASFLQRFRYMLAMLCEHSRADTKLFVDNERLIASCSHRMEILTSRIVHHKKDMARVAPYLIADILSYFETMTFLQCVKVHVNNCLYSLISICDNFATSFLLRTLNPASRELFKLTFDNYKKYHCFTGNV